MALTRRIPISLVLAAVVALACAAPSPAHGPTPRAWLTTGDRASLLAEQPATALGAPDLTAPTITVDPARSYQRIEGLGASITDSRPTCSPTRPIATPSCARSSIRAAAWA